MSPGCPSNGHCYHVSNSCGTRDGYSVNESYIIKVLLGHISNIKKVWIFFWCLALAITIFPVYYLYGILGKCQKKPSLKARSHDKLEFANSSWQMRVAECDGRRKHTNMSTLFANMLALFSNMLTLFANIGKLLLRRSFASTRIL